MYTYFKDFMVGRKEELQMLFKILVSIGMFVQLIPIIMMTIGVDVLLYDYGSGLHLAGVDLL